MGVHTQNVGGIERCSIEPSTERTNSGSSSASRLAMARVTAAGDMSSRRAAPAKLPLSTTHVISGAIMGAGLGDSVAPAYAQIVDMHECRTVDQLSQLVGRLLPV